MELNRENEFLSAYDAYADALFRHCYFRIHDRELAKDLTQEIFCRTWAYLAEGKDIQNIRAFLYRIANNLVVDEYRKKKPLSLDTLVEEGFSPKDETAPDVEERFLVKAVVQKLESVEEPYRTAVVMRFVDGLSPKEIASALDVSENLVSVRLHRGVKKLRALASDHL